MKTQKMCIIFKNKVYVHFRVLAQFEPVMIVLYHCYFSFLIQEKLVLFILPKKSLMTLFMKKKFQRLSSILSHKDEGFPFLKNNIYYYLQFIGRIYFFSFLWKPQECVLFLKTRYTYVFVFWPNLSF